MHRVNLMPKSSCYQRIYKLATENSLKSKKKSFSSITILNSINICKKREGLHKIYNTLNYSHIITKLCNKIKINTIRKINNNGNNNPLNKNKVLSFIK